MMSYYEGGIDRKSQGYQAHFGYAARRIGEQQG